MKNPFPKQQPNHASQQQQILQLLQSNPQLLKKYQQQLSKFQANQSKSSHPPMTSQQYLQKLSTIQKYLDNEGGLVIQPGTGFVLKYVQKRTGQKIFVNVVTHEIIDHPEEKLLVDFQNQPGLRIPMSMGKIREDHDKSGNVCKVLDVVMNPKIVQTAQADPNILAFTGQIIGNYLLEKYKIAVSDEVLKKVKGLKYKGTKVEYQRVKGKKAPKIQQLSQTQLSQKQKQAQKQKQDQLFQQLNNQTLKTTLIRPQFQIHAYTPNSASASHYQPYSLDITQYSHLKIVVDLPHLIHSKGIHLQGNQKIVYLSVKNLYELCLKMPYQVGKWKAVFCRKERKLVVKVYRREEEKENKDKVVGVVNESNKPVVEKPKVNINLDNDLLYELV